MNHNSERNSEMKEPTMHGGESSRNVIDAIMTLCDLKDLSVKSEGRGKNRINGMGEPFEAFGKKLFAGAFNKTPKECLALIEREFSYLGEKNNPPDAMIRGGDAIEFKKIERFNASSLQLNSSFPKHSLTSDSSFITKKCKDAEPWNEKDIVYVVGVVDERLLKRMWMVYGADYCDDPGKYFRLLEAVNGVARRKIRELGYGMDEKSKEPARVNVGIDNLNATRFRLRAIWEISSPWVVFKEQYQKAMGSHEQVFGHRDFEFVALINESKWETLDNACKLVKLVTKGKDGLGIYDVKVSDPAASDKSCAAKMIIYTR